MLHTRRRIWDEIVGQLALPLIVAPMYQVSGVDLVKAACNSGVIGAFPTANAGAAAQLDSWVAEIAAGLASNAAPYCPNVIMRDPRALEHLEVLASHRPRLIVTSVGSPTPAVDLLARHGTIILADVATVRHAKRAVDAGADGLILLTAGSGGNTGWLNPLAFAREVRRWFDGPVVLSGGIIDGVSLAAARTLGCDLGYAGTRFIAARESLASEAYGNMLIDSGMDDIVTTPVFSGLDANILRPSIIAAGLDPDNLPPRPTAEEARLAYGAASGGPRRWTDIWSAGHTVSGVYARQPLAEIVQELAQEYHREVSAVSGSGSSRQ